MTDRLNEGNLPNDLKDFHSQVEKVWRAFVVHGVRIAGRVCFNVLIEQMNTRDTALPPNRAEVASEGPGVLYYNSEEDLLVNGSIDGKRRIGKVL